MIRFEAGIEAVARAARIHDGAVIELPRDFSVLLEILHKKEGLNPRAFHVAVDDLAELTPLAAQDTTLIASASAQEAADLAVLAALIARETSEPVIHFFDREWVGREFAKIDVLDPETIRKLDTSARGGGSAFDVFERLSTRLAELTGRRYPPYEYSGHPEAERVAVALGVEADRIAEEVEAAKGRGEREGLVRVRLWRPFKTRRFLETFPFSTKSLTAARTLHADVLSAIHEGVVGGWSWFVSLPPIAPLPPPAIAEGPSPSSWEAVLKMNKAPQDVAAAIREFLKDLGPKTDAYFQCYEIPETPDRWSLHIRISPFPIRSRRAIQRPHLEASLEGLSLASDALPAPLDAGAIARQAGLGERIGPVVVSCLLILIDAEKRLGLSEALAFEILSEAVEDRWGDFSQDIVEAHIRAMEMTRKAVSGQASILKFPAPARSAEPSAELNPRRTGLEPDPRTEFLGFRLGSPLIACVSSPSEISGGQGDAASRRALAESPLGAVFLGPVEEQTLDREAWKAFATLNQGAHPPGFKARPPLEKYLDAIKAWKTAVEVPVVVGLSAVSEKNWLSLAFALEQAGADALEIFLRSPEEGGPADPVRIVSLTATALKIPVSVRITPALEMICTPEEIKKAGARALVLFDRPRGTVIDPEDLEPKEEALLTGPLAFRLALPALPRARERMSGPEGRLDLGAAGPVSEAVDLFRGLLTGARAVYVPAEKELLGRLHQALKDWMGAKGFASLEKLREELRTDERASGNKTIRWSKT